MPETTTRGCLVKPDDVKGPVSKVYVCFAQEVERLKSRLEQEQLLFLSRVQFNGQNGKIVLFEHHSELCAVFGLGSRKPGKKYLYEFGGLANELPEGYWQLDLPTGVDVQDAALGFALGAYRFSYAKKSGAVEHEAGDGKPKPVLVVEHLLDETCNIVEAIWFVRDLINTPANMLGPEDLALKALSHVQKIGAVTADIIKGEKLFSQYPAIAEVGKGSERQPCVLRVSWQGSKADEGAPCVYLVGKGVCFDSGGYDLKPSSAMLRMKKDMGGAALMAGLAGLLMQADLPIRLELRLGCVENSVSGRAMRPLDVIETRKGLRVEIGNTDAEGRLVLCDLLAEASENMASMIIDAATLTGAARVALGPDIPALFSNSLEIAQALLVESGEREDPLWPLPLWEDYEKDLESDSADLNNVSSSGMAGAITAALFLKRFVGPAIPWAHIDTYAWNDSNRPGRPKGGEALALRTLYYFMKGHNFNMNNNYSNT